MSSKPTGKAKALKAFESIISEENKAIIEKILDSVDGSSCYSGHIALRNLVILFGKDAAAFITNLMETSNPKMLLADFKEVSPETRRYTSYLNSVYGYRLRGILSGRREQAPDMWVAMDHITTRYDPDSERVLLKFAIHKNSNDCVIIEDTIGSMILMSTNILEAAAKISEKHPEFRKYLDIEQGEIKKLSKITEKLGEIISASGREKSSNGEKS